MNNINPSSKEIIKNLCNIEKGKGIMWNVLPGKYTFITGNLQKCPTNSYNYNSECILLVAMGNDLGKVFHWESGCFTPNYNLYIIKILNT